jgi:hypothetical protein
MVNCVCLMYSRLYQRLKMTILDCQFDTWSDTLNFIKPSFCFFFCVQILDIFYSIYPTYLLHNSHWAWSSVISLRLDFQRYRVENVFRSLISTRLDRRGCQPTTNFNPRNFFLSRCLKCSLPFKPIVSLIFC